MGCAKPEYCGALPEPRRCVRQTPLSCATFVRLIDVSGEYRWLCRLPPLVGQPRVGSADKAAAEKSLFVWAKPDATSNTATPTDTAPKHDTRIIQCLLWC